MARSEPLDAAMVSLGTTPTGREDRTAVRRRLLAEEDVDAGAAVIARAFHADPVLRVVLPDPEERERFAAWFAAWQVRTAVPYASVWGVEVAGELAGVAVWRPPSVSPGSAGATFASVRSLPEVAPSLLGVPPRMLRALVGEPGQLLRLLTTDSRARRIGGAGRAWYLAYLAVLPEHQGQGLARQLLDHVLRRCDEDGLPAWLETTDPANPPRYERFGFQTVHQVPAGDRLPGVWVMRREPTPAPGPESAPAEG